MKDTIGDRMKGYENCYRLYIPRKSFVIIRIDGKAFHAYTRGCEKPFDKELNNIFCRATLAACEQIQNVKFAYHQSDEISFVLTDFENIKTDAWFGNNIQKMTSVAASIFTAEFNRFTLISKMQKMAENGGRVMISNDMWDLKMAQFDARVFMVPSYIEVYNYYLWRQRDCEKNSVQSLARANFPHKELQNKNGDQLQELLFSQKNLNWNDCPANQKRGEGFYKKGVDITTENGIVKRNRWFCDENIPIFSQDLNWFKDRIPENQ
jgi:tRNA(His) 5'-end guanylyltransferase